MTRHDERHDQTRSTDECSMPPRMARRMLARLVPTTRGGELLTDLDDDYRERAALHGRLVAGVWYWAQVLRPSTTNLGRELGEVRTMKVGSHRVPGIAPKGLPDILRSETKYAFRSLRQRPGFSTLVVLTLGLGIGANTAIFTVVNGVLLSPLAYPDPEGLVVVASDWGDGTTGSMSLPDIVDLETESTELASLVGYSATDVSMTGLGEPTLVPALRVQKGLLSTFGLAPTLGRDIAPGESGASPSAVVMIGHGFWRDHFDASPDVIGSTLTFDGIAYEIVGVAPPGFDYPNGRQLWYPRGMDPEDCARGCHAWRTIGRLVAGGTVESARAEADAIAARLTDAYPASNTDKTFDLRTLRDQVVGDARTGLWLLLGAGLAVLLIACSNVANLILARAETRRGEAAVRTAMGASRGRLIASMLSESALLALLGGGLGLAIAGGGVALLRGMSGNAVPRVETIAIDVTVLAFTLLLVTGVTLAFGLAPALRTSRDALVAGIRRGGRGSDIGGGRGLRNALTMAETALAVVLLFGAGLMLRTFGELYAVDPGFETDDVLRVTINLPEASYADLESIRTFFRTLEERIALQPGVEAVGSIYGAPLSGSSTTGDVLIEGRPEPPPGQKVEAWIRSIGPGYLETMRIPVLEGRGLSPADDRSGVPVAVVSRAFARAVFGDVNAIGERVRITASFGHGSPYHEIVGIAGDVRSESLTSTPVHDIYVPQGQVGPRYMTVNVRSSLPAGGLIGAVRSEVRRLDADLAIQSIETVAETVRGETASTRFLLFMVGGFASLALVLAAVGIYGVTAYLVSRRVREVGVRVALGARPTEILRLVMVGGLGPALAGLALGIGLSLAGGRVVEGVIYGITPRDPWTLGVVPLFLLLVAVVAVLVPAFRATRVDPATVLRAE